ncbi:MAG TPA: HPP family protein [Mariprofundaceae bacterium]|nr:HPP family protein [Mariprofundaceae bacterium]
MNIRRFLDLIGVELNPSSFAEKAISGMGGFLAIFMIFQISYWVLGSDAYLIVASMGAATVLLFAVPHGPLSQPWPLFGGNLISACIGVASAQLIPDLFTAGAVAVGTAIAVMYFLKCIHPPGGATALSAVVGGEAVHSLGYMYVVTPVLLNVLVIFSVAVAFNWLFKWRRYPAKLVKKPKYVPTAKPAVSHEGIEHALRQIDSFIDVSEEDLNEIYRLARAFDQKSDKKG